MQVTHQERATVRMMNLLIAAVLLAVLLLIPSSANAQSKINLPDPFKKKIPTKPKTPTKPSNRTPSKSQTNGQAPKNDDFANRQPITGNDASGTAENMYATVESGEPQHNPGHPNAKTIWWTWTAPANGNATIDMIGTTAANGDIAVYVGEKLEDLQMQTQENAPVNRFKLTFPVQAGRAYEIASNQADPYHYQGIIVVNIHFAVANVADQYFGRDNFMDRPQIKGAAAMLIGTNYSATNESGEPEHNPGHPNAHTVWWSWTAPKNGTVLIDTAGASIANTNVGVYTGEDILTLSPVIRANDATPKINVRFKVKEGESYQIATNCADPYHYGGVLVLNLHFFADPPPAPKRPVVKQPTP